MKPVIDRLAAALILVVAAPVLLVVAAAIRITLGSPVIFRQTRLGLDRKPFTVYKFRSMRVDADPDVHRRFLDLQRTLGAAGLQRFSDPRAMFAAGFDADAVAAGHDVGQVDSALHVVAPGEHAENGFGDVGYDRVATR